MGLNLRMSCAPWCLPGVCNRLQLVAGITNKGPQLVARDPRALVNLPWAPGPWPVAHGPRMGVETQRAFQRQ